MQKIKESLDVRSLQMFVTVMESDSMTEAAEKLEIKQSTITHAMDKLRNIFADPLFVRSGRSVKPTDRATELLPKIKKTVGRHGYFDRTIGVRPEKQSFSLHDCRQ